MSLIFRNRRIVAMMAASALTPAGWVAAAQAQDTPVAAAPADDAANAIVVIGTRRLDRSATTSASPVDVISASDLASQPSGNMLDTLKNIVPSFYVPQNTISDASTFVRSPSLRGLPGDEILVMLNGKRYNRSALVQVYAGGDTGLGFGSQGSDISAIPTIAVKSLQILRDGATAQYGSDAIAGVLNYGLKDARSGFTAEARYGQYQDRGDGKSEQLAMSVGLPLGEDGFLDISGEFDHDGQTSRGVTRVAAANFAQNFPALASQIPNYPLPAQIWGTSPSTGVKLVINAGYEVLPGVKYYLFGNFAYSHANESFNYRPSVTSTGTDSAGVTHTLGRNGSFNPIYLTACPTGNATCPSGGYVQDSNTFSFASLYPAGFTPRFVGNSQEIYITQGFKGALDKGTWDLSMSSSKNTLGLSMYDSLSASYGPSSQTAFKFGTLSQQELDVNLDLTYPIELGLASPLTLSGGGEYRKETYGQSPGDPQSYGAGPFASQPLYALVSPGVYTPVLGSDGKQVSATQSPGASGYGGTSPLYAGNWSQKSWAAYVDAEVDPVKGFSIGLAGRYEHYNTFGGSWVGKANALWQIVPAFAIRGTVGNGFHAPSPGQANDAILTTNFVAGNQVQTGTYPVTSPISKFYGATTLTPEKSFNIGAGFVFKPAPGLVLTVDAYSIKVTNRIGISKTFTVSAADVAALPALASVGVGGVVNYFTNGFDTKTKGVDVVATYRTMLMDGSLNLTLAYNYNKSKVLSYDAGVLSTAQIINIGHLAPNHRGTFSGSWTKGPWTINARENYYGSWENATDYPTAQDSAGNVTAAQVFGAKFTTDLDVSYTFGDHFTLTAGANNLFNVYPDKIAASSFNAIYPATGGTADGQVYPRTGGPFGLNGGLWYVRARITY